MPMIYYKLYRRYFEDVRFRFVPFNFPPGGVYVCPRVSRRPRPRRSEPNRRRTTESLPDRG